MPKAFKILFLRASGEIGLTRYSCMPRLRASRTVFSLVSTVIMIMGRLFRWGLLLFFSSRASSRPVLPGICWSRRIISILKLLSSSTASAADAASRVLMNVRENLSSSTTRQVKLSQANCLCAFSMTTSISALRFVSSL